MVKITDPTAGLNLKDLLSDDGVTFDFGQAFQCDDDSFKFDPTINMTDDELVKIANLELFGDEDEPNGCDNEIPLSLGLNFDKIKEKMVDLSADGKVKKLVRQTGVGDVVPPESVVTIKYSGYFEDQDEPYDSSHLRGKPDKYHLNQGNLILGLDIAIKSMQKHEVSVFWIHPDYAFGERGCLPLVPPKSEIMYIVHLIDYIDNTIADIDENLTPEQQHVFVHVKKFVNHLLTSGANNFKLRNYRRAIRDYKRAGDNLEEAHLENKEEEVEMDKLISRTYQNLAICYNKENMPRLACIACNKVVHKTAKTYYHYGKALTSMGEYLQALEQIELGLKMCPDDKNLKEQRKVTIEFNKKYSAIEKRMWGRCLGINNSNDNCIETEYKKIAQEFCEEFMSNKNILRQRLPDVPGFAKAIRLQALVLGINVTTHERYSKQDIYLQKSNYM